eukprot:TRINITY_DN243_c0_g1_i1.p1 TRINITY_DN243_c0_g1~~TRINITY_DN243_c0_g1_i1.p1  ORF type:complete len:249 (-),score=78.38 TRINITY_DN243_c0_g1_i1:94-789(-)
MVKYAVVPENPSKVARARGNDIRVHFKNTREAAMVLKGMRLKAAEEYLQAVLDHKRCVPFRRFNGGVGRTGQAKEWGTTQGRWPQKSVKQLINLLRNAKANAKSKGLTTGNLFITHVAVQRAQRQRRRTYRAHGRINPYMSSPSHIEFILSEKEKAVPLPTKTGNTKPKNAYSAKKKIVTLKKARSAGHKLRKSFVDKKTKAKAVAAKKVAARSKIAAKKAAVAAKKPAAK